MNKINYLVTKFRFRIFILLSVFFIAVLNASIVYSENDIEAKEYALKTAFLYNFARLVEWPEAIVNSAPHIQLCLIGDDPFGEALQAIKDKKAQGKAIFINRHVGLSEILRCHILFISQSEANILDDILKTAAQYPVLLVSELPGFVQKSGHIRFLLRADKTINLEINLEAIKQSDLKISSRILSLAEVVASDETSHD